MKFYNLCLCISTILYYSVSKLVFDNVFITSQLIIDEEFHLPQGLKYCNLDFISWDPKITTLPGLYLISFLFLSPFSACSTYWLRFINLVISVLNIVLFYICFNIYNTRSTLKNLISSINIALLPPLYFFAHVYYTDVISITFILCLLIFSKKEFHFIASFFGASAIIIRQTNIIWILMVFGEYLLTECICVLRRNKNEKRCISIHELIDLLNVNNLGTILKNFSWKTWLNIISYCNIILAFAVFVLLNGSIVVGDKTAHSATLHFPQLFYFTIFSLVFGWPYFIIYVKPFFNFILNNKLVAILLIIIFALTVYLNTLEHAYLVADNRHYTFYIWNRFYGKYLWFRYTTIPVYLFGFYVIYSSIYTKSNLLFVLVLTVATVLVLALQKMVELRYFFVPYILVRLHCKNIQMWQLTVEFMYYILINVLTFNIFFSKEIYWIDYAYPQRLIW